jgi:hypothetical protein
MDLRQDRHLGGYLPASRRRTDAHADDFRINQRAAACVVIGEQWL